MSFNKHGAPEKASVIKHSDVKKVAAQFERTKDEIEEEQKKANLKKSASKE